MSKAGKNRTLSPDEAATRAAQRRAEERASFHHPDTWGADKAALERQPDVSAVVDRRGRVQTAQRTDIFDRLLARQALSEVAHQAIRRLDSDMTERRGEGERGTSQKVDSSGSRDLITQRMIDAGDRVEDALSRIGLRDRYLLSELLEPKQVMVEILAETMPDGSVRRREVVERWRQVVVVMAGETHQHAQGAVIRSACENLALAYRDIDHKPRRAA